jgi:hypothetical protein
VFIDHEAFPAVVTIPVVIAVKKRERCTKSKNGGFTFKGGPIGYLYIFLKSIRFIYY